MDKLLKECVGFQWDNGNSDKNWIKHKVSRSECEEIFFNLPLIVKNNFTLIRLFFVKFKGSLCNLSVIITSGNFVTPLIT